jgi:Reverse transcriptase (RNA-dependent DNA polymerase)
MYVHHQRLIHNLRKRQIPKAIAEWTRRFLENRTTKLAFNNTITNLFVTPAGILQGSPLSPLLYMYYNADLLDISTKDNATALGFIDEVVYGVSGISDTANVRKLKRILKHTDEWRSKHGAQFEVSKYVLVHFTKNPKQETKAAITLDNVKIQPSTEAKYLGVIFDQKLNFKSHLQHVTKKGTTAAMALSSIAKSNWGAQHKDVRQLFQAAIASHGLCSVHLAPAQKRQPQRHSQKTSPLSSATPSRDAIEPPPQQH